VRTCTTCPSDLVATVKHGSWRQGIFLVYPATSLEKVERRFLLFLWITTYGNHELIFPLVVQQAEIVLERLTDVEASFFTCLGVMRSDCAIRSRKDGAHATTFGCPLLLVALLDAQRVDPEIAETEMSGDEDSVTVGLWQILQAKVFETFIVVFGSEHRLMVGTAP
jgi:hypothetical protein